MILGQTDPTQQNPVNFTPPNPWGDNKFPLPRTGFYSHINPFSKVMTRMHAFPAWRPTVNAGPQPMPSLAPPAPPAASAAPAPGPTPGGTHGAFGGSGFGSSGGVRAHSHIDPYRVMRSGMIPGVSPNGSNIRAGYTNAGARVYASMPYQSHALAPDVAVPPVPVGPGAAPALPAAPMPAATHGGFGSFSWNPINWFRRSNHAAMMPGPHNGFGRTAQPRCEWVGPRLDGTMVQICGGRVMAVKDGDGNVLYNAYANPDAY